MDRYDFETRMDQLTVSIGTRLTRVDQQIGDLKKLQVVNNRQLFRKPQPGLTGAEKFVKHALLKLCGGDDPVATYRQRYASKATTDAATTTVPEWAGLLSSSDARGFLLAGETPSLFGRLLSIGLDIGDGWPVKVPYRVPGDFVGDWIEEGAPIPVEKISLAGVAPVLRKLATISAFSRELRTHSNPAIQDVLDAVLRRDINAKLDATLVDALPQDSKRPAGLLFGVAATPAGADFQADLKTLANTILTSGATSVSFLTNPAALVDFAGLPGPIGFPLLVSSAIPANRTIAIDPDSFVGALIGASIDSTENATIHMSDPAAPLVDGAGAATPISSLWQVGAIGLRCLLDCGWAIAPNRIAFIDRATP